MKAYITCPVSLSKERLSLLPLIKSACEKEGFDSFVFKVGGTPNDIFKRDYNQLKSCDVIIAEVSEPSHGVGIEIGLSYSLGLTRILLIEKGKTLTKLAKGMPKTEIIEYKNSKDLEAKLISILNKSKS